MEHPPEDEAGLGDCWEGMATPDRGLEMGLEGLRGWSRLW